MSVFKKSGIVPLVGLFRENHVGIIQQQLRHPFLHTLMSYQVETAVADAPHQITFLTPRNQNHIISKNLGEYFAHHILALVIIRKNASGQIVHLRVMLTE